MYHCNPTAVAAVSMVSIYQEGHLSYKKKGKITTQKKNPLKDTLKVRQFHK